MSSTTKYILLGVVVAALLALFLYYGQGNKKKEFDWRETYIESSKEPFGSYVIFNILKSYFPNKSFNELNDKLSKAMPDPDTLKEISNYVFVGDGFYADTADTDKILKFVAAGHQAFFTANVMPKYLLKSIFKDSCEENQYAYHRFNDEYADSIEINLNHPQLVEREYLKYIFLINGERIQHNWSYIDTLRGSCTEGVKNFTPLGNMSGGNLNFAKVQYGKGTIFLHSTPLTLTNYYLLDSSKLRYASKVFSHLTNGAIYWDTKSRTSGEFVERINGSNRKFNKDSPLKYILEQPALRWAWFIFLGLIVLYLVFRAKRKQRIIPVLEQKTNTSLDFIHTIGHMYFQQGNHIQLCDTMLKQFQTFVREKYHLASREMNEEFVRVLSLKSDIPESRLQRIVDYEDLIYRNSITENTMVEFYHLLNNFYKTCK